MKIFNICTMGLISAALLSCAPSRDKAVLAYHNVNGKMGSVAPLKSEFPLENKGLYYFSPFFIPTDDQVNIIRDESITRLKTLLGPDYLDKSLATPDCQLDLFNKLFTDEYSEKITPQLIESWKNEYTNRRVELNNLRKEEIHQLILRLQANGLTPKDLSVITVSYSMKMDNCFAQKYLFENELKKQKVRVQDQATQIEKDREAKKIELLSNYACVALKDSDTCLPLNQNGGIKKRLGRTINEETEQFLPITTCYKMSRPGVYNNSSEMNADKEECKKAWSDLNRDYDAKRPLTSQELLDVVLEVIESEKSSLTNIMLSAIEPKSNMQDPDFINKLQVTEKDSWINMDANQYVDFNLCIKVPEQNGTIEYKVPCYNSKNVLDYSNFSLINEKGSWVMSFDLHEKNIDVPTEETLNPTTHTYTGRILHFELELKDMIFGRRFAGKFHLFNSATDAKPIRSGLVKIIQQFQVE